MLPLFPFPLPLFPLPLFPLPVAAFPLVPLPELPSVALFELAAAATDVGTLKDVDVALEAGALLLTATAVAVELLAAVVVVLDLLSLHTVSLLAFALRTRPGATVSWASPCVTLRKFSLTSPSELEMRTTPVVGA